MSTSPNKSHPKIMIVAGENSGDLLAAGLVAAIKAEVPGASFVGVAGEQMLAQGVESIFPVSDLNVMGLVEVLPHLKRLFNRRDVLADYAENHEIDLLITVDFQDFNASLAKKIKKHCDIPCIHYVSPTVWAWRRGRIFKMAKYLDHVLALFPFEPKIYEPAKLPCTFVGHPLASEMAGMSSLVKDTSNKNLKLAVLPGSRTSLIKMLLPTILQGISFLEKNFPDIRIVVPIASEEHRELIKDIAQQQNFPSKRIKFVGSDNRFEELAECKMAIAASGTSNLELAMLGLPMLVVYKFKTLTYRILRPIVDVDLGSPVNYILGRQILPELVQHQFNAANVVGSLRLLLSNETLLQEQKDLLQEVRKELGEFQEPGASVKAAKIVLSYL